ncbi:MAG: glycosyltransferase family 2 protein [Ignavibacteria bacterium]|nr:glycosyltransferase family 2 protein [Ignavibacteria bacterium]
MISFIIVNFRQGKLLCKCVESLYEKINSVPFEIIIVNNSPDEELNELSDRQNLRIIQSENSGFSKGCNLGAKYAKGEFLMFLNPDTALKNDFFQDLIDKTGIFGYGAVGLKLYYPNNNFQISFGKFPTFSNERQNKKLEIAFRTKDIKIIEETENNFRDITPVDWVSGTSLFMKKLIFDEIKGFDERFFMYYEDADLCKRLSLKGFKTYFYPYSGIIHYKGENTNPEFKDVIYYYSKHSQLIYYSKHNNKFEIFLLRTYLGIKFFFLGLVTFNKNALRIFKLTLTYRLDK